MVELQMEIDQLFIQFSWMISEDGLRQDQPMVIADEFRLSNSKQVLATKLNAELMSFRMPSESAVVGVYPKIGLDKTEKP